MYLVAKAGAPAPVGAVTQNLDPTTVEYQKLTAERGAGTASWQTLWEEIAEEDIAAGAPRVWVVNDPGAATAANESATSGTEPPRPGSITQALMVADSPGIVGQATNSRTLTVVQGTAQGAGAPARTTLATLALVAGVNAPTGQPSSPFTINQAAFIEGSPFEVISTAVGTGLADPGGLVFISYTPV